MYILYAGNQEEALSGKNMAEHQGIYKLYDRKNVQRYSSMGTLDMYAVWKRCGNTTLYAR